MICSCNLLISITANVLLLLLCPACMCVGVLSLSKPVSHSIDLLMMSL